MALLYRQPETLLWSIVQEEHTLRIRRSEKQQKPSESNSAGKSHIYILSAHLRGLLNENPLLKLNGSHLLQQKSDRRRIKRNVLSKQYHNCVLKLCTGRLWRIYSGFVGIGLVICQRYCVNKQTNKQNRWKNCTDAADSTKSPAAFTNTHSPSDENWKSTVVV